MSLKAVSNKVTYVGSGVYAMGSLSCAICGHLFPLTTSPHDNSSCENCGAKHSPYELVHTNNYYKRCRSQNDVNNKNMINESALGALHSTLQFSSSEINDAQRRVRALLGQNTLHESETSLHNTSQKVAETISSSLPHKSKQQMKKEKSIEHANVSTSVPVTETAYVDTNSSDKTADKQKRKSLVKIKEDKQEKVQEETDHATLPTATHASSNSKFTKTLKRAKVGTIAVDHRVIEEAFCENCHTHRPCWTFSRQTRSADEGQTIFFQCTKCLSEWQQNS